MDYRILNKANFLPEGEAPLRVMRFDDHHSSPSPHGHEFEELVIITHGTAIHHVGARSYRLARGDVFVILGDTVHTYMETEQLGVINILFDWPALGLPDTDLRTLPGYQALFEVEPRVRQRRHFRSRLRLSPERLEELLQPVAELERELTLRPPGYRFAALGHWVNIVSSLSRAYASKASREDERHEVSGLSRVLGYMESHLAEVHTVEALAARAGMSPASFFRAFAEIVGCPPIRHLNRLRIDRAKRLLADPGARIGEVSEAVGFEDSNYFTRQFRQFTGMPPRQWQAFASTGR